MLSKSYVNREEISKLVDIFYQHEFKTFYVNSVNGKDFIRPFGVFVSLGLTTSMTTLENIKNILEENGYIVKIAEISSKKINSQYLNTLTKNENLKQYKIDSTVEGCRILEEKDAKEELKSLESILSVDQDLETLAKTAPKISSLRKLIEKLSLTGGWDEHLIQCSDDGEYGIFHRNVNYKREQDLEYRIGIYVVDKKN